MIRKDEIQTVSLPRRDFVKDCPICLNIYYRHEADKYEKCPKCHGNISVGIEIRKNIRDFKS